MKVIGNQKMRSKTQEDKNSAVTQVLFQREVLIDAPLAQVWQLVATESGLRQWWGNRIALEAKEGGRCEEWRSERNRTSHWQGVVTLYMPPHQLMLTMKAHEATQEGPQLTTISITLEAKGEQTRVYVTQRAFGPTAVIGTPDPRVPVETPTIPQPSPRAQLDQPAPGSLPLPSATQMPASGRIEPAYYLLTQQQTDELTLWWERRFTSLAAASAQIDAQ